MHPATIHYSVLERFIYLAVIFGWATSFSDSPARGSGAAAVHLLTLGICIQTNGLNESTAVSVESPKLYDMKL